MKKIFFAVAMCLMLAGDLTSCSSNSPEGVVEKFMEAMKNEDAKAVAELFTFPLDEKEYTAKEAEKAKEEIAEMVEKKVFKSTDKKDGIKDYKITSVEKDGDKVIVKVNTLFGNGDEEESKFPVVKDKDGNWKLLFDMNK